MFLTFRCRLGYERLRDVGDSISGRRFCWISRAWPAVSWGYVSGRWRERSL
jgi:hypothetical protein